MTVGYFSIEVKMYKTGVHDVKCIIGILQPHDVVNDM